MFQAKLSYPEAFKRDIVQLYILTKKSAATIEQEWKVEPGLLLIWHQQYKTCDALEPGMVETETSHVAAHNNGATCNTA